VGRQGKSAEPPRPSPQVRDGELFAFQHAAAPPLGQVRANKLHYHEHRARLRQRLETAGAEALSDSELLELYLFPTIARQDARPLAKALLERFGSLAALLACAQAPDRKSRWRGRGGLDQLAESCRALRSASV